MIIKDKFEQDYDDKYDLTATFETDVLFVSLMVQFNHDTTGLEKGFQYEKKRFLGWTQNVS